MRNAILHLFDRIVVGGLVFLIVITPILFGTVHPWAYHAAETVIFVMLVALTFRIRQASPAVKGITAVSAIAVPACALLLLIGLQLLPLPPRLLHFISPQTYITYSQTLRGWPDAFGYPSPPARAQHAQSPDSQTVVMPTQNEVQDGASVPFTSSHQSGETYLIPIIGKTPNDAGWYGSTWRPLSMAPPLGISSALKLCAAFALFAIVALYPIAVERTPSDEDPLTRLIVTVILISGFIVAALGLIQQATWNGKILWFYIPLDWRAPNLNRPRMMGPFVNPDHFAAYLAMIAPLYVSRAWRRIAPADDSRDRDDVGPILSSAALVIVVCGILLSQSRAIWGATFVACVVFAILASRLRTPGAFRMRAAGIRGWAPRLGITMLIVGALAIVLLGSAGRDTIDMRVGASVAGGLDFWHRVDIWRDTLRMFRDYRWLGVGFGSWPEVFPHYQKGPWPAEFLRNAHNDYVEVAAELGIFGVAAFAFIAWRVASLVWRRWRHVATRSQLTVAALLAGVAVEGFHELFDFSLTIPAIGFLFAIYVGLIVRICLRSVHDDGAIAAPARGFRWRLAPYAAALFLLLAVASQLQASIVYPYYPPETSFAEARAMVLLHPLNSGAHLNLASWYGSSPTAVAEVARSVWIDPRNPFARDLYAHYLFDDGHYLASLDQIALSVMWSPTLASHLYLKPRLIPYLSTPDRHAIERGLNEASDRGYPDAFYSLGQFYIETGRVADGAAVYQRGAEASRDPARRLQLLMLAGDAYARAGRLDLAARSYDAARAQSPARAEPYIALLRNVILPRKDSAAARALVAAALDAGVDPVAILATYADVASAIGDPAAARAALLKMVDYDPTYDNLVRLGEFYAWSHDYTRAAAAFRRATDVDPDKPAGWIELAGAEDAGYHYVAADRDYRHASDLDPTNADLKARYTAFKQKMAQGHADLDADGAAPVSDPLAN